MPQYVRRWRYEIYFSGEHCVYAELDMLKEEVARRLDLRYHHDNWKHDTLRSDGTVKVRKAPDYFRK